MADSFADGVRHVIAPLALSTLKSLQAQLDGTGAACPGLGISRSDMTAAQKLLVELRRVIERAHYGVLDRERFERFRSDLIHIEQRNRVRSAAPEDVDAFRAFLHPILDRAGDVHQTKARRSIRESLQAEVDELYRIQCSYCGAPSHPGTFCKASTQPRRRGRRSE